MRSLVILGIVMSVPLPARAHAAPSADVNNRYLKATLLGDEVRLSFTLFFGDRPGAAERRRIDRNHDGKLDDGEAQAFGAALLGELAPGLGVVVDGTKVDGWQVADVGLGNPTVTGGALSLDLTLTVPLGEARAEHTLALEDGTMVEQPGESETRFEESPGVRLVAVRRADAAAATSGVGVESRVAFTGNPRARGEREIVARFTVPTSAGRKGPLRGWMGGAAVVVASVLAVWWWGRRSHARGATA